MGKDRSASYRETFKAGEASMLEATILRIGELLQVGFGSTGTDVVDMVESATRDDSTVPK